MWKNIVEPDRPQMTIWRMRIACWISKATDTHSEYVILIAFPRLQWLHERAWMSCLYLQCLSCLFEIRTLIVVLRFTVVAGSVLVCCYK